MLEIYRNIKLLRKSKGWSQEILAEKVGYTAKGMISSIENGKVDLPLSKVEQFAEVFGVEPAELVGDSDFADSSTRIEELFSRLNEEGQEMLIRLAEDMVNGGRYKKEKEATTA